jgi:hypothetical protein
MDAHPVNIYEYEEERRPMWDTPAPCGLGRPRVWPMLFS